MNKEELKKESECLIHEWVAKWGAPKNFWAQLELEELVFRVLYRAANAKDEVTVYKDLFKALDSLAAQTYYRTTLVLQYDDEDGYWFGMTDDDWFPPKAFPVLDDAEAPRRKNTLEALVAAIEWHNKDTQKDMDRNISYRKLITVPNINLL